MFKKTAAKLKYLSLDAKRFKLTFYFLSNCNHEV